jgi:hypothetical protein
MGLVEQLIRPGRRRNEIYQVSALNARVLLSILELVKVDGRNKWSVLDEKLTRHFVCGANDYLLLIDNLSSHV